MKQLGVYRKVTFGSGAGACDVLIQNADKDRMVKELKHRFEPVSIRGWRNIFRIG